MCVYIYIYIHVYMYIYIYIYTCVCMCIYIYICKASRQGREKGEKFGDFLVRKSVVKPILLIC